MFCLRSGSRQIIGWINSPNMKKKPYQASYVLRRKTGIYPSSWGPKIVKADPRARTRYVGES
jgi:hypothetical protein